MSEWIIIVTDYAGREPVTSGAALDASFKDTYGLSESEYAALQRGESVTVGMDFNEWTLTPFHP